MSACIIYSTKITTTVFLLFYHTQFNEVVIRSIQISYFNGQFKWHSNGMVMEGERHGNSMGMAWYV
jgi:hypothetical protein